MSSKSDIAKAILGIDKGIRAVLWVEGTDDIRTMSREGLPPSEFIVPWNIWRLLGPAWIQVIAGVARKVSDYAGEAKRIVFYFEKFDLLMVSLPSGDFVVTVDKGVRSEELANKIIERFAST